MKNSNGLNVVECRNYTVIRNVTLFASAWWKWAHASIFDTHSDTYTSILRICKQLSLLNMTTWFRVIQYLLKYQLSHDFNTALSQNDHFDWFQVSDREDNLKGKSKRFYQHRLLITVTRLKLRWLFQVQ